MQWTSKRRDEDVAPRPAAAPVPPPVEVNREPAAPVAPKPAAPETARGVAAIGKSVLIKGQILSREDLYLDGEMEGTVEVPEHRLTVGPHAKLQASVRAREVVVLGSVTGNVEAMEKLDIRKEARLVGDVKTGGIVIEDGAYFKGSIDIVRSSDSKGRPAAAPKPETQPVGMATPVAAGEKR